MQWIKIFGSEEETIDRLVLHKLFTVAIGQRKICLFRDDRGVSAFNALCPHAGASLSDGFVNASKEIVCPLHGYRFSLLDGKEKSGHTCELTLYATEMRTDGFYLGFK